MKRKFISVKQAGRYLGCSSNFIYTAIHEQDFPKLKQRNLKEYKINFEEFQKWAKMKGYKLRGVKNEG